MITDDQHGIFGVHAINKRGFGNFGSTKVTALIKRQVGDQHRSPMNVLIY